MQPNCVYLTLLNMVPCRFNTNTQFQTAECALQCLPAAATVTDTNLKQGSWTTALDFKLFYCYMDLLIEKAENT